MFEGGVKCKIFWVDIECLFFVKGGFMDDINFFYYLG